jgi:hypothetical protein
MEEMPSTLTAGWLPIGRERVVPNRARTGGSLSLANEWPPFGREWVAPYAANAWRIIARELTHG